jgi:alpha-galactosidase
MILFEEMQNFFHLQTKTTSYIIKILNSQHLGHVYYGDLLPKIDDVHTLETAFAIEVGGQVIYDESDKAFNLNLAMLEISTYGKGDFRDPMLHFRFEDGSRISDFKYKNYQILKEKPTFNEMPEAFDDSSHKAETLVITMRDNLRDVEVDLYYSVFFEADCITRRSVIRNGILSDIIVEKADSMNMDFLNRKYQIISLDGAWIRERHITEHTLNYGILKIDSKKGVSSSDHNPFIAIKEPSTNEEFGRCYAFGLIYSGNFEASVEVSPHDIVRVLMGINSFDFYYTLPKGEAFVTPEVVCTFSKQGLTVLSQHFHDLVKKNIISPKWQNKERPIIINNWEATYFDFTEKKLLKLARVAKKLGIELFVLDDGWFGKRNDDTSSLGDWFVNQKKLPSGLLNFAKKINKVGLDFGLWVEPEMINIDSELYRIHPDWVISHPDIKPSFGRNQLILDLTNSSVQDYLIETLTTLFKSAPITYIKWDMNRNFSDVYSRFLLAQNQGAFFHLYTLGLYKVLSKLTSDFPDILFESCSSGGNRFDLGMLYYMPQTWTSDNTDGIERLFIQYGTSYAYPPSTMGAHVSQIPNEQTLRQTPLETRFNTAIFGLLGYEMDLTTSTTFEKKVIKKQVTFYKQHRALLQFGKFYRSISPFQSNLCLWYSVSEDLREAIVGIYKIKEEPNSKLEKITIDGLNPLKNYQVENRTQYFNLQMFGHLVHHALPINLNSNGILFHLLQNRYLMKAETENIELTGQMLSANGFVPKQNFIGSGYNESVRLMGDFGSRIYYISKLKENSNEKNHQS